MCISKYLGFIPSRTGSLFLAYLGIATSICALAYVTYTMDEATQEFQYAVEHNNYAIEYEPGEEHLTRDQEQFAYMLMISFALIVTVSYYVVHAFFILFSVLLAVGAHTNNICLLNSYFVYGFFHFLLMLYLASVHYYLQNVVAPALLLISDILFAFCLFGLRGHINSLSAAAAGEVNAQPGLVYEYKA